MHLWRSDLKLQAGNRCLLAILPSEVRGGVEEYVLTICVAAVHNGWSVHVAFPHRQEMISLERDFLKAGISYHPLEISERANHDLETNKRDLERFWRTIKLLLKVRPDLVQISLPWPDKCFGSIMACSLFKVKTVVTFHLIPHPFLFTQKRLRAYNWARRRKQRWTAVSDNNRMLLCGSFQVQPDEITRIYNGARLIAIPPREDLVQIRNHVRTELALPPGSRIILSVGRLTAQKGYEDLIPIIPSIVREFNDVWFVWVGEGELRERLTQHIKDREVLPRVLLLGYRTDVSKLLWAADLFLLPTRYEGGQSFALSEAMTHGVPLVTSDASGIPEVVRNGEQGLLFQTGDNADCLDKVRWALTHPDRMHEMAKNALDRASMFSQEKMISETLALFERH